jgi:hypothetical protein
MKMRIIMMKRTMKKVRKMQKMSLIMMKKATPTALITLAMNMKIQMRII